MELRLPPTIDEVVQRHTKWLMQKLYDSRERNGDVIFVLKAAKDEMDIEIPVPPNQVANEPAMQVDE